MGNHVQVYERILHNGPSQDTLHILLKEMKDEGRSGDVIRECVKFLKVYPEDIRLRYLLAESCMQKGFLGQAEDEFARVVSAIEGLIPAFKQLARIYARQGRNEEAAETVKRFLTHCPGDQEAIELLESVELTEEPPLEILGTLVEEDVTDEKDDVLADLATPTIAELYHEQGQLDSAVNTYERVVQNNPHDHESIRRLEELRALIRPESEPKGGEKKNSGRQEEKVITILERWLDRVKELKHD
jgi:tetratricopeptide (TPR) repeat protein